MDRLHGNDSRTQSQDGCWSREGERRARGRGDVADASAADRCTVVGRKDRRSGARGDRARHGRTRSRPAGDYPCQPVLGPDQAARVSRRRPEQDVLVVQRRQGRHHCRHGAEIRVEVHRAHRCQVECCGDAEEQRPRQLRPPARRHRRKGRCDVCVSHGATEVALRTAELWSRLA